MMCHALIKAATKRDEKRDLCGSAWIGIKGTLC